jgi:FKBP-type peptidyl-prolyl cis-trans isomerase FkpA
MKGVWSSQELKSVDASVGPLFYKEPPMKIWQLAALSLTALHLSSPASAAAPAETLSNGVKITHTVDGTGAQPKATDTVKVHYRGTLANGTEFDSSYKRGQPATFPLSRVIPCWTEGMQKIKVGGKATLTCPAASAYGDRGAGSAVPPNAVLTFEVELLGIEK